MPEARQDEQLLVEFRQLVASLRGAVEVAEVHPRRGSGRDLALLALLSKAIRTTDAVSCLIEAGFTEDASALCRVSLDVLLASRFIAIGDAVSEARGVNSAAIGKRTERDDSEGRARRFIDFASRVKQHACEVGRKHAVPKLRAIASDVIGLEKRYPRHFSWSNLSNQAKSMAMERDPTRPDEAGNPGTLAFVYEGYYPHLSHFVHPTIATLGPHAPKAGVPFRIFAGVLPPPEARVVIVIAALFLLGTADYVTAALGIDRAGAALENLASFCGGLSAEIAGESRAPHLKRPRVGCPSG